MKYNELFNTLTESIDIFVNEIINKKSTLMATDKWNVKDELCHIVFWHEMYASNYQSQANNVPPELPDNMSTINERGVSMLRKNTIKGLIERLYTAHKSLYINIVKKEIPHMTYSKGGRTYTTEEFLIMINRHINTHTKQVKRAK